MRQKTDTQNNANEYTNKYFINEISRQVYIYIFINPMSVGNISQRQICTFTVHERE